MVSCSELGAETKQVLVSFCSCRASEMERQVIVFALLYVRALDLMSCLKKHEEAFFLLGFSAQRFQRWQIGRRCIRWHRLFIVIQNMVGKIMMYSKHVQQY